MTTQMKKAERFKALHERAGAFVIPNPWDIGSARLLAGLGFEALATTSVGFANSLGRADGEVTLSEVVEPRFRSARIWRTVLRTTHRRPPRPSGSRLRRDSSAARLRITAATPRVRSMTLSWRSSAFMLLPKLRALSIFLSP